MDVDEFFGSFEQCDVSNSSNSNLTKVRIVMSKLQSCLTRFHLKWSLDSSVANIVASIIEKISSLIDTFASHESQTHIDKLKALVKYLRELDEILLKTHSFWNAFDIEKIHELVGSLRVLTQNLHKSSKTVSFNQGKFRWVDGLLVECVRNGYWLLLDNANLCNPAILDRLNGLLEPHGFLSLDASYGGEGDGDISNRKIVPHPNFRMFLAYNPHHGEVSQALRNRCLEIHMHSQHIPNSLITHPMPQINSLEKYQSVLNTCFLQPMTSSDEMEFHDQPQISVRAELIKFPIHFSILHVLFAMQHPDFRYAINCISGDSQNSFRSLLVLESLTFESIPDFNKQFQSNLSILKSPNSLNSIFKMMEYISSTVGDSELLSFNIVESNRFFTQKRLTDSSISMRILIFRLYMYLISHLELVEIMRSSIPECEFSSVYDDLVSYLLELSLENEMGNVDQVKVLFCIAFTILSLSRMLVASKNSHNYLVNSGQFSFLPNLISALCEKDQFCDQIFEKFKMQDSAVNEIWWSKTQELRPKVFNNLLKAQALLQLVQINLVNNRSTKEDIEVNLEKPIDTESLKEYFSLLEVQEEPKNDTFHSASPNLISKFISRLSIMVSSRNSQSFSEYHCKSGNLPQDVTDFLQIIQNSDSTSDLTFWVKTIKNSIKTMIFCESFDILNSACEIPSLGSEYMSKILVLMDKSIETNSETDWSREIVSLKYYLNHSYELSSCSLKTFPSTKNNVISSVQCIWSNLSTFYNINPILSRIINQCVSNNLDIISKITSLPYEDGHSYEDCISNLLDQLSMEAKFKDLCYHLQKARVKIRTGQGNDLRSLAYTSITTGILLFKIFSFIPNRDYPLECAKMYSFGQFQIQEIEKEISVRLEFFKHCFGVFQASTSHPFSWFCLLDNLKESIQGFLHKNQNYRDCIRNELQMDDNGKTYSTLVSIIQKFAKHIEVVIVNGIYADSVVSMNIQPLMTSVDSFIESLICDYRFYPDVVYPLVYSLCSIKLGLCVLNYQLKNFVCSEYESNISIKSICHFQNLIFDESKAPDDILDSLGIFKDISTSENQQTEPLQFRLAIFFTDYIYSCRSMGVLSSSELWENIVSLLSRVFQWANEIKCKIESLTHNVTSVVTGGVEFRTNTLNPLVENLDEKEVDSEVSKVFPTDFKDSCSNQQKSLQTFVSTDVEESAHSMLSMITKIAQYIILRIVDDESSSNDFDLMQSSLLLLAHPSLTLDNETSLQYLISFSLQKCIIGETEAEQIHPNFDVYSSSLPEKYTNLVSIISSCQQRVVKLLESYPEHLPLAEMHKNLVRILDFKLSTPVIGFLVCLDHIHLQVQTWNDEAPEAFKIPEILGIKDIIVIFRKLQLSSWSTLLQRTFKRLSVANIDILTHLFIFTHESLLKSFLSPDHHEILRNIFRYTCSLLESSNLCQYQFRVNVLEKFILGIRSLQSLYLRKNVSHVLITRLLALLTHTYIYYRSFALTITKMIDECTNETVSQLKELHKISQWRDFNYWSLTDSTTRSHRKLYKYVKKYENSLRQPSKNCFVFEILYEKIHQIYQNQSIIDLKYFDKLETNLREASSDSTVILNFVSSSVKENTSSSNVLKVCLKIISQFRKCIKNLPIPEFHLSMCESLDEFYNNLKCESEDETQKSLFLVQLARNRSLLLRDSFKFLHSLNLSFKKYKDRSLYLSDTFLWLDLTQNYMSEKELMNNDGSTTLSTSEDGESTNLNVGIKALSEIYIKCILVGMKINSLFEAHHKDISSEHVCKMIGYVTHMLLKIKNRVARVFTQDLCTRRISRLCNILQTEILQVPSVCFDSSLASDLSSLSGRLFLKLHSIRRLLELSRHSDDNSPHSFNPFVASSQFPITRRGYESPEMCALKNYLDDLMKQISKLRKAIPFREFLMTKVAPVCDVNWRINLEACVGSCTTFIEKFSLVLDFFTTSDGYVFPTVQEAAELLKELLEMLQIVKSPLTQESVAYSVMNENWNMIITNILLSFENVHSFSKDIESLGTDEQSSLSYENAIDQVEIYHDPVFSVMTKLEEFVNNSLLINQPGSTSSDSRIPRLVFLRHLLFAKFGIMRSSSNILLESCHVLTSLFLKISTFYCDLLSKGFQKPSESDGMVQESMSGNGEAKETDGTGIGEGSGGSKDVSKEIMAEDQLHNALEDKMNELNEGNDPDHNDPPNEADSNEKQERGIELSDGMEDASENEFGNMSDNEAKDLNDEMDKIGTEDDCEVQKLDQNLWGDKNQNDDNENEELSLDEDVNHDSNEQSDTIDSLVANSGERKSKDTDVSHSPESTKNVPIDDEEMDIVDDDDIPEPDSENDDAKKMNDSGFDQHSEIEMGTEDDEVKQCSENDVEQNSDFPEPSEQQMDSANTSEQELDPQSMMDEEQHEIEMETRKMELSCPTGAGEDILNDPTNFHNGGGDDLPNDKIPSLKNENSNNETSESQNIPQFDPNGNDLLKNSSLTDQASSGLKRKTLNDSTKSSSFPPSHDFKKARKMNVIEIDSDSIMSSDSKLTSEMDSDKIDSSDALKVDGNANPNSLTAMGDCPYETPENVNKMDLNEETLEEKEEYPIEDDISEIAHPLNEMKILEQSKQTSSSKPRNNKVLDEPEESTENTTKSESVVKNLSDSWIENMNSYSTHNPIDCPYSLSGTDVIAESIDCLTSAEQEVVADEPNAISIEPFMDWNYLESTTQSLSLELCERLRMIIEPNRISKLSGGYKSGKRLNMKKVISYVASNYTKDRIWMRRLQANQRAYQVLLALDDSSSMCDNNSKLIAMQSISMLTRAFQLLEVGQLSIASFGSDVNFLNSFDQAFSNETAKTIPSKFTFKQNQTRVSKLLYRSIESFEAAAATVSNTASECSVSQLLIIISDGRGVFSDGSEIIQRSIRTLTERNVMVLFLIIDNPDSGKDPINSIKVPIFRDPAVPVKLLSYLDIFPFPYYLILRDINSLPETLCSAIRQWFESLERS